MEISYKKLQKQTIFTSENIPVSKVAFPIIDPQTGNLLGYYCKPQNKVLTTHEITGYYVQGIILNDNFEFNDVNDLPRIADILKSKIKIIKLPVYTTENEYIGKCRNIYINTKYNTLTSILVQKSSFPFFTSVKHIIPKQQIIEITSKKIIVKPLLKSLKLKIKDRTKQYNLSPQSGI